MPTSRIPLYNAIRSLLYSGSGVTCPVCNRSFRKMMPGGNDRRPNARCPYCDALERHRLFWLFIQNATDITRQPCSLLHFAPENCFIKAFAALPNINYTSADLNSPLAMVHADITNLLFTDSSFDYVICSHVLEHIGDDAKAVAELYRVVKKEGTVFIMTPVDQSREETAEDTPGSTPEDRKNLFGAEDHLRIYGRDFTRRLSSAGFTVECIDYYRQLDTVMHKKHALSPDECIYRCTKPG